MAKEENWVVYAKDKTNGKVYVEDVYTSEYWAYYNLTLQGQADAMYHYGDFEYSVEKVDEYTEEMLKSKQIFWSVQLKNQTDWATAHPQNNENNPYGY